MRGLRETTAGYAPCTEAVLDYVAAAGRPDDRAGAARHEALRLETTRLLSRDPCARVRAALLENAGAACRLSGQEIEMLLHDDRNEDEPPEGEKRLGGARRFTRALGEA